jgi:predicted DNA-binding mobile mystery protein A
MSKKSLQVQQLNGKLKSFVVLRNVAMPPTGWIKAIRITLGMSMRQLGNKLGVSKQNVMDFEKREKEGTITLKSLREIARAMDMQLVYGFVPNEGTLNALIEKRATELATQIVMRTANTMKLEDQSNTKKRIQSAIKERAIEIQNEMPKILWD